jgi:hypothetical protein
VIQSITFCFYVCFVCQHAYNTAKPENTIWLDSYIYFFVLLRQADKDQEKFPKLSPNSKGLTPRRAKCETFRAKRLNACATWFWNVSLRNISLRRVVEFVFTPFRNGNSEANQMVVFWMTKQRNQSNACVLANFFSTVEITRRENFRAKFFAFRSSWN